MRSHNVTTVIQLLKMKRFLKNDLERLFAKGYNETHFIFCHFPTHHLKIFFVNEFKCTRNKINYFHIFAQERE